jgi:mannose-1-phosphate guanylyltransferase/mannose-6-phosphate isomerase
MRNARRIVPVILSGGSGSRLWPLSRRARPKQFASLDGARTMIQDTALRFVGDDFDAPVVVTGADQAALVAEQLVQVGVEPLAILREPLGRNTGPAAVAAAAWLAEHKPNSLALLINADNRAAKVADLHAAIAASRDAAQAGSIVLFGVAPTGPETIYGYILAAPGEGVRPIVRFEEKPDAERARLYVLDPNYLWNGGMVLLDPQAFVAEAGRVAPAMTEGAKAAVRSGVVMPDGLTFGPSFAEIAPEAVDTAIFERTDKAMVVHADFGWSDVGTWNAIWMQADRDEADNALIGGTMAIGARGNLVMSDGPAVVLAGVENLAVIVHGGAVLIVPRDDDAAMRRAQKALEAEGPDLL